ncbi:MAG TPA: S53 family peptidase [Dictyobacter sp.]|nr:S53 family peptidase [Dictyobacter sp.]
MSSNSSFQKHVPLADSDRSSIPAHATPLTPHPQADEEIIDVTIRLRATNPFTEQEIDAHAISGQPPIAEDILRARYDASAEDMDLIRRFADAYNLTIDESRTSAQERKVVVQGTVAAISKAFKTQLHHYEQQGHCFRARTGPLSIPGELEQCVTGVFGIDNRTQAHIYAVQAATSAVVKPLSVPQIAQLYEFPTQVNGTGQTVAIIELGGGYQTSDLQAYFKSINVPMPQVISVSVDGAKNTPGQDADAEVVLDIEIVGAVAPGSRIVVYFAPNTDAGFLNAITAAINDKTYNPSIISISWGAPEAAWTSQALNQLNQAFQEATLHNISVFVASGDTGAADSGPGLVNVDFPSSSPYVSGCGGTRLEEAQGKISSEVVWNDGWTSATGGGVSSVFARPSWQKNITVPPFGFIGIGKGNTTGRGVPDIAGNADPQTGYKIYLNGSNATVGGTSAVAPLWAGLTALYNQSLQRSIGYLNPVIYQSVNQSQSFRDIISGNNNGYPAEPGWDPCTGLGSPRGQGLLDNLRTHLSS